MSAINRKFFFDHIRVTRFGGSLAQTQVLGMTAILDYWDAHDANGDDRWLAYILGTVFHETDQKMQPINEYGSDAYFDKRYGPPPVGQNAGLARTLGNTEPGDGARYHGRGFVQLTGRANYARWSARLGSDLVGHPELALDLATSTRIIVDGALVGAFTGKKLDQYFSATIEDWVNARRVINRLDKAQNIAGYGKSFYAAISYTT